ALVSRRGDQIWSGEGGLNTDPLESEGRGGVKPEVPRPGEEPRRIFSEQLYREAADAIRERYRNEGFLSAEVAFRTADVNLDRGTARVRFQIREGPRTHVASVVAEGAPPGVDLAALSTLRPGQPLSASAPEVQRVLLTRELNRRGYLFAQVEVRPELSPSPSEGVQHARVRVLARPGPQVRVGQVIVQGSGRSDERMVRANLSLREGQVLDPESLYASQRDLLQLGVYRSAVVRLLAPEVEEPTKDIVIELKDRPQLSGDFGIGYSLVEGPRVTTSALYPNVGGRGINVTSRLKLNYVGASALVLSQNSVIDPEEVAGLAGLGGRANVSAVWPRIYTLLPIQLNGRLDLVGERVQRPSFLFTRYAAITGVDWVVNRWLNLALQYEIEHDRVNAVRRAEVFQGQQISSLDEQRLRFDDGIFSLQSLRFTPTLDFRDEPINPRKGFFIQGGAEVTKDLGARVKDALGVLEPTTVFTLKLSGNVTAYVPVVSPVVLAFSARAGTILPLEQGSTTIAPKRFFLGGASSMRGFREDGVIPQDRRTAFRQEREACRALASGAGCSPAASILQSGRELPSPGGEMFTLGKAEARFPAFNAFDLGVFFEAGNLWLSRLDVNLLDVRTAAGVGLRYLTPVGPLVFDLGFNLDPDPALNEQTAYVHFSIGLF
ncbi:MAG TPA: BamA/TamA family outer membrane protein, partial [Myxococcaceae bacterium]|nr:BamA/TamA family outer membrane protein [Myxococcaceae bacterium]